MGAVELNPVGGAHPAAQVDDDAIVAADDNTIDEPEKVPAEPLQVGVQDVEAITMSWSKGTLIAVFIKYVRCLHPAAGGPAACASPRSHARSR